MIQSKNHANSSLKIVWPIVLIGGVIGLFLSWFVLSGDQQGRVNLFYLLLVYLFIPVLSVIASIFSTLLGKGINLARLLSRLPLMSYQTKSLIRKVHQLNLDKYWFLMQSQAAAIAFSLASLATFFTLLLATDLNFVWRSTILVPADILPLLDVVAWPWTFWDSAQPSLALLESTQDSRLALIQNNVGTQIGNQLGSYGGWWKFILATQLCYSLVLRIILIIWSRWWLKRLLKSDIEQVLHNKNSRQTNHTEDVIELSTQINKLKTSLVINNWDGIPLDVLASLPELDLSDANIWIDGWLGTTEQLDKMSKFKGEQLVIVKAWEGPLGELEDFLELGKGYLLPLDWNATGLIKPKLVHLQEWQRFIAKLPNWSLYIPEDLFPE